MVVVTNEPIPFLSQPQPVRIKIILSWLLNEEPREEILNGSKKISNILLHVNGMKFNSYLRLFNDDHMAWLQGFLTESSWELLKDFKANHSDDKWICPKCEKHIQKDYWQCDICLICYHNNCAKNYSVSHFGVDFYACSTCFIAPVNY